MKRLYRIKIKLVKKFREKYFEALYFISGKVPAQVKHCRGIRILIYHGVATHNPTRFNSRFLSVRQFEGHLIALKKFYNPIDLEDLVAGRLSSAKLNVILTFDDGLKNNIQHALPLLLKHKVPAIFFVTGTRGHQNYLFNDLADIFSETGPPTVVIDDTKFTKRKTGIHQRYFSSDGIKMQTFFQTSDPEKRSSVMDQMMKHISPANLVDYGEYLELMNDEEIRRMAEKPGITVGFHSATHADLPALTAAELQKELSGREELELLTGKKCDLLAFPYGNYNEQALIISRENGFTHLFGTEKLNKIEDRADVIERFTVNPFVSPINQMYYIAKGNYE